MRGLRDGDKIVVYCVNCRRQTSHTVYGGSAVCDEC